MKIIEVELAQPMRIGGETTSVYSLKRYPAISFNECSIGLAVMWPDGSRTRIPWAMVARVHESAEAITIPSTPETVPSTPKAKAHAA